MQGPFQHLGIMKATLYYERFEVITFRANKRSGKGLIKHKQADGYYKETHTWYEDVLEMYEEELERGCRTEPWDAPRQLRKYKKGQQRELFDIYED